MKINEHTRISFLVENHTGAIDTLISISPKFRKLRNPVLRKLLAKRATISMAAGIAGVSLESFFDKLRPLGFEKDLSPSTVSKTAASARDRSFHPDKIVDVDVRDFLENERDPLPEIMKKLRSLKTDNALRVVNSFEPTPLMRLLGKQGYKSFTERISPELFHTFFYRESSEVKIPDPVRSDHGITWDEAIKRFITHQRVIDVRMMEMPGPMVAILEALEKLPKEEALFVYHKKFPLFLIPELNARGFSYLTNRISDSEIHLLIYHQ